MLIQVLLVQANSVNLDIKRVVAYRHWCNKLWNAVRFAMMNLGDAFQPSSSPPSPTGLPFACRWILSRLNSATEATVTAFETYTFSAASQVHSENSRLNRFSIQSLSIWPLFACHQILAHLKPAEKATMTSSRSAFRGPLWVWLEPIDLKLACVSQALYSWWQYELCDVFIELVKPVMARSSSEEGADADKQAFRETLWICLDTGLRYSHSSFHGRLRAISGTCALSHKED